MEVDVNRISVILQWKSYIENQVKQNKIFKNYGPTVGLNHAPNTQQARALPTELAGNSVELV